MGMTAAPSNIIRDAAVAGFYRRRKALVVGADGFLGLNCVDALRALGADVSIVSRRARPRAGGGAGKVFRGDLRDRSLARAAVAGQTIVFDFAGVSSAVASNRDPLGHLDAECRGQLNLFHACAETPAAPLVVFCSSRLVYGRPQYLPVDEHHPLAPQSLYAVHKITAEHYLHMFHQTHGLDSCILRLSNPYGPRQPPEAKGYGVINHFIRAAARGEAIRVFGDGTQRRDYIYVHDVIAAALLCAAEAGCRNETFNLGGSAGVSLREAAQTVARLAGGTPVYFEPWPADYLAVETGDYATDLTKLRSRLRLPPETPFAEGLWKTLNFYRAEESAPARLREPIAIGCALSEA